MLKPKYLFLLIIACAVAFQPGLKPGMAANAFASGHGIQIAKRSTIIIGCLGDADRGDSAELKLLFTDNGAMIQYDENQVENRKRTFGAWELDSKSPYLMVYWPNGSVTSYTVKRIGPILHFAGLQGRRNFTLRKLEIDKCWEPKA